MQFKKHWLITGLTLISLSLAGCSAKVASKTAEKPAISEPFGNAGLKRVTLTQKARERLGLQTVALQEEQVARKRAVGAEVVGAPNGNTSTLWVRVWFTDSDLTLIDREQPVQVFAQAGKGVLAKLDKGPGDAEDDIPWLYFAVSDKDHGLKVGQTVTVELMLKGSAATWKVVPYAAVLYDTKGDTWTYTSTESLTFVRQKVKVDYIDGDKVYLSDGPAVGTMVVTLGAAELYGTETGVGK